MDCHDFLRKPRNDYGGGGAARIHFLHLLFYSQSTLFESILLKRFYDGKAL